MFLIFISALMFVPILIKFLNIKSVPNFPTLIVSGFIALSALISYFSGIILSEIMEKEKREYEFRLQLIEKFKE